MRNFHEAAYLIGVHFGSLAMLRGGRHASKFDHVTTCVFKDMNDRFHPEAKACLESMVPGQFKMGEHQTKYSALLKQYIGSMMEGIT